jgi:type II secretory pathway component GspD/PulD (secretin)
LRLVANPRITTLDNQRAIIQVGQNVPIAVFERNAETGRWEITGWEDDPERVGIILEVTPQVSPDGHIRLKIKPEVSEIDDWVTIEGDRVRPITNTRTAETEVMIRDTQTVVIGGLVKDKTMETIKKVPLLGDLPFIGKLFTHKEAGNGTTPVEKVDLLIFVTASILKDVNEPLIGYKSNLTSSPQKPFKLDLKDISLKR